MTTSIHAMVYAGIGFCGILGAIAVSSPRMFAILARYGGTWVDSGKALAWLDKTVDIDRLVLPHCRLLGAAVLAAALIMLKLYMKS